MNAQTSKIAAVSMRDPFPPHQISKLPKATKAQNEAVKNDYRKGIRCELCNGWHHPDVVHLDYVGHAALTDRLLDVDPEWSWEPVAFTTEGLPALDRNNGLWIRLTVGGVTRLGYGGADGKNGTDAIKEIIGDALRNAAMRFGAALDLWHKGDLHLDDEGGNDPVPRSQAKTGNAGSRQQSAASGQSEMPDAEWAKLSGLLQSTKTPASKLLNHFGVKNLRSLNHDQYVEAIERLEFDLAAMAKAETNQRSAQNNNQFGIDAEDLPA